VSRVHSLPAFTREETIRSWVRRKLGTVEHEVRVARVAKTLFDVTQRWHGLGNSDCRLLSFAALLHDVGRVGGEEGHAKRGAEMILKNTCLPLGDTERQQLAYFTRYHRGHVPEPADAEILDLRDNPNAFTIQTLLGLLRAADALDSRSEGGPRLIMTVRSRILSIYGYVNGDAEAAENLYGRPKKFKLLESTLNCEVRTQWFSTEMVALVS